MNFAKRDKSIVDFVFILALFSVFMIAALFVVLFGSEIYKKTVSDMDANYASRTALAYVTEKMHSHDYAGGADVADIEGAGIVDSDIDGHNTLALYTEAGGAEYVTYLYVQNGYLKEYTGLRDKEFDSEKGMDILPVKEFIVTKNSDSLYSFHVVDSNQNITDFHVALYSASGDDTDAALTENSVNVKAGEEDGNE